MSGVTIFTPNGVKWDLPQQVFPTEKVAGTPIMKNKQTISQNQGVHPEMLVVGGGGYEIHVFKTLGWGGGAKCSYGFILETLSDYYTFFVYYYYKLFFYFL